MGRIRRELVEEIIEDLVQHRLVILEGPVGSGKSRALSTVAARSDHGSVRRLFPEAHEKPVRYSALAHLVPEAARAHIDLVNLANEHGSLLLIVDNIQHLDEGSLRLLLWAIQNAPISLLVSCTALSAIPLLVEAKFEPHVRHRELPALSFEQIEILLEEIWGRPARIWEVVATTRFAGANLAAVKTFAGFIQENFPDAQGPEIWQKHLKDAGKLSHTTLYAHVRSLRENHEAEIFDALQILAVAGPCTLTQAVQWIPASTLQKMSARGLLAEPHAKSPVQLANGLLDLSMRLSMEPALAREIFESRVSPVVTKKSISPPPELINWWKSVGLNPPRELVLAGARSALLAAQPASALSLLEDDTSHEAAWLASEAHVLLANSAGILGNLPNALNHPQAPQQLGASEALVCLAAGFWPDHAERFKEVGGLEAVAKGVYLSALGEYDQCITLAESLERSLDEQMWQNVQAFAALGEVMAGKTHSALQRIATLGATATDASSITTHNVAEAKQVVQFLSGNWKALRKSLAGGYGLHALVDRTVLSTDIGLLLGEPSGATAEPINFEAPAPFGYAIIRELARVVTQPVLEDALLDLQSYNLRYAGQLPNAVRLLAMGWELKLRLEADNELPASFLEEVLAQAQSCDGTLAQLLGMLASGMLEDSWTKLDAATALAHREGLGSWLPRFPQGRIAPSSVLSTRELEIATLAAEGVRSLDIAVELDLSVRTVEKHLGNIYKKLEITGRDKLRTVLSHAGGSR